MKELIIDMPKNSKHDSQVVLGSLMVRAMEHNYLAMMQEHGDTDRASKGMRNLFGEMWDASKERIWQWYDIEQGEV